jgi:acetylglutamate kinase
MQNHQVPWEDFIHTVTHIQKTCSSETIVVKYGGNAMTEPELQQPFAQSVVLLNRLGMKVVVVHGGGPQIQKALDKIGKKSTFIQGLRVTDVETMQVVQWVLLGEVQRQIITHIQCAGGQAVGLSGHDTSLIKARPYLLEREDKLGEYYDLGQVGEVATIHPQVIKTLQNANIIPVISPIGLSDEGKAYNINADITAGHIAMCLQAKKFIVLSNIPGVLDKSGHLLPTLHLTEIEHLIKDKTIYGGMLPKIVSCMDVIKSGVEEVHILDGRTPYALLSALSSTPPLGTTIKAS